MMTTFLPMWATQTAVVVAAISLLGLLIRQIGPWRRIVIEEEAQFRANLIAANEALTARVEKVEKMLYRERARRNAERSLDRHKISNITACLDSATMMLELNPDRALEVVAKIKEMRAMQMVAEAKEAATIYAAEISAADDEVKSDQVKGPAA